MERLPELLAGEPVYRVERITALPDGRRRAELGFSDVAAHAYEDLVTGTVELLTATPGVAEALHEDRELVHVTYRDGDLERLLGLVDRFWFDRLPTHPVDPSSGPGPAELLASPWPAAPPPPKGAFPTVEAERGSPIRSAVRDSIALPPSRGRVLRYLILGAVLVVGGLVIALGPVNGNGLLPLALGVINLVIGLRLEIRHRQATAASA